MKVWIVDAVGALQAWRQPDDRLRLEVSQWLRLMRRWGPPSGTPWTAGSDALLATHEPTGTMMMFRERKYGDDHLFAGVIKVLRFIEP